MSERKSSKSEQTLRNMLGDPQFAHLRLKIENELAKMQRRRIAANIRREELGQFPFKVRVRLESKDRAMNTWHSWNIEANDGHGWVVIGNTGDTSQGWVAHYYPNGDERQAVALATRWQVKDTKHEAVLLIAQEHADRLKSERTVAGDLQQWKDYGEQNVGTRHLPQTVGSMLPGERYWRSVLTSHSANSDPRNPAHDLLKAAARVVELIEESDADRWDAIASHREALDALKAAIDRMRK